MDWKRERAIDLGLGILLGANLGAAVLAALGGSMWFIVPAIGGAIVGGCMIRRLKIEEILRNDR